jgi:hypothetical protein
MATPEAAPALWARLHDLEMRFLDPSSRRHPEALADLLADDFVEFGSSGRVYSKPEVLAFMRDTRPPDFVVVEFAVRELSPGCALVTFRAVIDGAPSLRSSIWVEQRGGWRMTFHQGTPVPASPRRPYRNSQR